MLIKTLKLNISFSLTLIEYKISYLASKKLSKLKTSDLQYYSEFPKNKSINKLIESTLNQSNNITLHKTEPKRQTQILS